MNIRRSLGALTPDQVAQANSMVSQLSDRVARLNQIIWQAETAGIDARLVNELRAQHAQLIAQLGALAETAPSLDSAAFAEWVARATGVESQVIAAEARVEQALPGAESRRTTRIVVSTLGALAVAGGIAALVWYGTRR